MFSISVTCVDSETYNNELVFNMSKFSLFSRQILDQDNYSPIPAATEEEYRQMTSQFPIQETELDMVCYKSFTILCYTWIYLSIHNYYLTDPVRWVRQNDIFHSTQMPFPKKFPFSEFVPKVYSQLKEFIYACLKYSEDLHLR